MTDKPKATERTCNQCAHWRQETSPIGFGECVAAVPIWAEHCITTSIPQMPGLFEAADCDAWSKAEGAQP